MDQVWATFIIGVLASAIAVWGIFTQRAIARRRATFDHISRTEGDAEIMAARRKFIELAKDNGGLAKWADEEKEKTEEVQAIKVVLNDFELVAIGIQLNIIDEEFYRRWFMSGVTRHWRHARPFVAALRTRTANETLFHEFEQMAGWFSDDKPPQRKRWLNRLR